MDFESDTENKLAVPPPVSPRAQPYKNPLVALENYLESSVETFHDLPSMYDEDAFRQKVALRDHVHLLCS